MNKFVWLCRVTIFKLILRPFLWLVLGVKFYYEEKVNLDRPTVFVANHNSHLDALSILASIPFSQIDKVHPVVAQDYFYKNAFMRFFFRFLLGSVSVDRSGGVNSNPLEKCEKLLQLGHSLIIFPEGSRGKAEEMTTFKNGVSYLLKSVSEAVYVPIFCTGLGRIMPKGDWMLVPSKASIRVGKRHDVDRELEAKAITACIRQDILALKGA